MTLDSYLYTSPGGRDHNEDAVGRREIPGGEVFLLADGLGGHRGGEAASTCVVDSLTQAPAPQEGEELSQWLEAGIAQAHQAVTGLQESSRGSMKSTVVALALTDREGCWAHVGDSRLYWFRGDRLQAYTHDHSVAYAKYKCGEITRAQIGQDEDQSSLLRALGNPSRNQPDLGGDREPPQPGDSFLLCSDGVWEYLRDGEILVDLLKTETAQEWGQLLLLRVIGRVTPGSATLSLTLLAVR